MSAPTNVHLLVLVHGMWGSAAHLATLKETISEQYSHKSKSTIETDADSSETAYEFNVLAAESNQEQNTYDGIDWGGERVVAEIHDFIASIESSGARKVSRFSITGYSLGGLLARYVIGALHAQKFFERIEPVNFNTIATPHLGIPRYPSFLSTMALTLGPKLLGRTGRQFYQIDKWNGPEGRPLLEIMSEHDSIFYQALLLFPNVTIYANTVNDTTVPYLTAAIETEDPFIARETNGLEIELDEKYSPIIKSYHLPAVPPTRPPPPSKLSTEYWTTWKKPRVFIPPFLRFKFPLMNLVVMASLPLLFPMFFTVAITRLSLDSRASNKRTRLLEEGIEEGSKVAYIRALFRGLEEQGGVSAVETAALLVEEAGAEAVAASEEFVHAHSHAHAHGGDEEEEDAERDGRASPAESSRSGDVLEQSQRALGLPTSSSTAATATASASSSSSTLASTPASDSASASKSKRSCKSKSNSGSREDKGTPSLTPLQIKMAASLNALPQLKKQLVYIAAGEGDEAKPGDTHAHAIVVARDMKRFAETHKRGLGVLRHWADQFVL